MKELLKQLKKKGNKIYSLGQKIEESNRQGMVTRIPPYLLELEKTINEAGELHEKLMEFYAESL